MVQKQVFRIVTLGTLLMVQWLSICLPMQGMWVQCLALELRSYLVSGN